MGGLLNVRSLLPSFLSNGIQGPNEAILHCFVEERVVLTLNPTGCFKLISPSETLVSAAFLLLFLVFRVTWYLPVA